MLKWLGLRPNVPKVRAVQRTEEEWRNGEALSLFLLVRHHHSPSISDWQNSLGVSTYNSVIKAGFAKGWTLPLSGGPRRHPLLDGQTAATFITLDRSWDLRHLAQLTVKETLAWDGLYRSEIYATGISFRMALHDAAMDMLIAKARVGEYAWADNATLCSFAIRLPVRREFVFPEPRATEKPYSEGPLPTPLRNVAKLSAEWIEIAALDGERSDNEEAKDLPLDALLADDGPVRISFD